MSSIENLAVLRSLLIGSGWKKRTIELAWPQQLIWMHDFVADVK